MANETILSGINRIDRVYSDSISADFVKKVVVVPLISGEDLPSGTLVKSYKNQVAFSEGAATTVSEGGSFSTNTQMTNGQTNLTAIKSAVSSKISVEVTDFGVASDAEVVANQSSALARAVDTEVLALFTSFTAGTVTATSVGTLDDLQDAIYTVHASTLRFDSVLTAVIGLKYANAIRKEVSNSAASQFTIPNRLSILGEPGGQIVAPNGFLGSVPGANIFVTSGFSTSGGDNVQGVFDSTDAIEGIYGKGINTWAIRIGQGNPSFVVELSSYYWHAATTRRTGAGAKLLSDT